MDDEEESKTSEFASLHNQLIQDVTKERIGAVVFMLSHAFNFEGESLDAACEKYGALRQDFFQAMRILQDPENWEFNYEGWLG